MTQPVQADRSTTSVTAEAPSRLRRLDKGVVTWCVAAAVLFVASGIYRGAQASRVRDDTDYKALSPFPLHNLPQAIDNWRVIEGTDTTLDPQTTRITGSTDHVIRTYRDELTGVTMTVLVLYGPAGPVTPHTPQVCYPASGFAPVGPVIDRKVEYGTGKVADFRSSVFSKSGGRSMIFQTVYHSYELNDSWTPSIDNRKLPRRNPGVFKVQIHRLTSDHELRGENEPIEAFLAKLLPVIEQMTNDGREAKAKSATSPAADPAAKPA